MDITTLKTRAAELAAFAELTEDQATELRSVIAQIETIEENAAIQARAIALTEVADVVADEADAATAGAAFVRSADYKGYTGRGTVAVETPLDARAFTGVSDLSLAPERVANVVPFAPLNLTSSVGSQSVSGNAIEWVVETFDSNAAVTAEGTAAPESFYSTDVVSVTLGKINHFVQASTEAVQDGNALVNVIDGKLKRGLAVKIENDIAAAIAGGTYATSTEATLVAAIRKAQAQVELTGYAPTTVLLNPADLADLDISFIATNKGAVRSSDFWGLTAVTSPLVAAGTAYVGDFATGVTVFNRGTATTTLTDAHEGNFIKGINTILTEARIKAVVTSASAIAKAIVD